MRVSGVNSPIKAIVFNFICLCLLGITIALFSTVGKPYHRGFFCDDESISKPFKKGTVSSSVAGVVGLLIPLICILVIEVPRFRVMAKKETKPFYKTQWFRWLVVVVTFLFVGAAATTMLTDVVKYSVGRLRPHFLAVCKPNFASLNCSFGFKKNFLTDYKCTGDESEIQEARLSFPSGHASFTAYCMVFAALYIDIRMSLCKNLQLFKPFVQFVFILLAILCGLSRVSDYKHHGSDVLAGLILGTLMAMFFIYKVLQLRHVDVQENENAHSIQTNTDKNELEQGEV